MSWKSRLGEAAEVGVGILWWVGVYAWGAVLTAVLVLAPLLLANVIVEIREDVPATVALAAGVIGAYALGLPPWNTDEREHLLLVVGGAAVSAVLSDLMRGTADLTTFAVVMTLTLVGWPVRRLVDRRMARRASA